MAAGEAGSVSDKVRRSGRGMVRRLVRRGAALEVEALRARVEELESEVQECRKLSLRVAELTDVVTELLIPVADQDPARARTLLEEYTRSVS